MKKDLLIATLGAVLLADKLQADCQNLMMVLGISTCLFIFLLFLEEKVEKWREYRKRVKKVQENVRKLRTKKALIEIPEGDHEGRI